MATYVKGASQVSLALQVLMGLAFIWWWMFWFLQPIETARNWLRKADAHISQDFLGTRGELATFARIIFDLRINIISFVHFMNFNCCTDCIFTSFCAFFTLQVPHGFCKSCPSWSSLSSATLP